jgi:hypothetical protein
LSRFPLDMASAVSADDNETTMHETMLTADAMTGAVGGASPYGLMAILFAVKAGIERLAKLLRIPKVVHRLSGGGLRPF